MYEGRLKYTVNELTEEELGEKERGMKHRNYIFSCVRDGEEKNCNNT